MTTNYERANRLLDEVIESSKAAKAERAERQRIEERLDLALERQHQAVLALKRARRRNMY